MEITDTDRIDAMERWAKAHARDYYHITPSWVIAQDGEARWEGAGGRRQTLRAAIDQRIREERIKRAAESIVGDIRGAGEVSTGVKAEVPRPDGGSTPPGSTNTQEAR